mmetsp:Transcript_36561/g.105332  ORF Transcript_36561/g.105332 Transcript_36561/m.105332 type:complete len:234 (-) Transcript_36561:698-1399(-)
MITGWCGCNAAMAVTAPSKLCSQLKPTRTETADTIDEIILAAPLFGRDASRRLSSTLSNTQTMPKHPKDMNKASMIRASMDMMWRPKTGVMSHAQRPAENMHQAKAMAEALTTASTALSGKLSSPSSPVAADPTRMGRKFVTMTDTSMKPQPAKEINATWCHCTTKRRGSSMPSSFGIWPEMEKRTACATRNEVASAKISFSASNIASMAMDARLMWWWSGPTLISRRKIWLA